MSAGSATAAAAAAAAIAEATRASGVIVRVPPADFLAIVQRNEAPLAVHASGPWYSPGHHYLTSYRGLAFFTRSKEPIMLPGHCQVVEAERIWIPG